MANVDYKKVQQTLAAAIVLIVAGIVAWLSYTREPAEAFLFPRYISIAFLVLSIWNFVRAATGMALVGRGMDLGSAIWLAPGLAIMTIYIFWMAKYLGFYVASTLTFIILFSIYDPSSHTSPRTWLARAAITIGFMAIMYGLFALVLKVQLPRGLFI
ncbi:MAG: tripartite tricarboxylate transporter TctB family protein [bacterium]|nr:tripartite tricarboxylate transporter TctB family protein [bacterium]